MAIGLVGTPILWRRFPARGPRIAIALLTGSYLGFLTFAAWMWM